MARDLGSKIRRLRQKKNLSQSELAQKAGVAQSTLSYLESGKKMPQFDTLSALCKGLGVSVLELLTYDEPKSSKKWPLQQAPPAAQDVSALTASQGISKELLKQLYEQMYLSKKIGLSGGT